MGITGLTSLLILNYSWLTACKRVVCYILTRLCDTLKILVTFNKFECLWSFSYLYIIIHTHYRIQLLGEIKEKINYKKQQRRIDFPCKSTEPLTGGTRLTKHHCYIKFDWANKNRKLLWLVEWDWDTVVRLVTMNLWRNSNIVGGKLHCFQKKMKCMRKISTDCSMKL